MKPSADVRAMREKGDSATSSSAGGPATERRPRARAGRLDPQGHCIRHVRAPCAGGRAAREWGDDRDDNVQTVAIEVAAPPAHHRRLAAQPLQRRGARHRPAPPPRPANSASPPPTRTSRRCAPASAPVGGRRRASAEAALRPGGHRGSRRTPDRRRPSRKGRARGDRTLHASCPIMGAESTARCHHLRRRQGR